MEKITPNKSIESATRQKTKKNTETEYDAFAAGFDVYEKYSEMQDDEDLLRATYDEWRKEYGENHASFFDAKNLKKLKKMDGGKRLMALARATANLDVTPDMVEEYYKTFPEDLRALIIMLEQHDGYSQTAREFNLYSASAQAMVKEQPQLIKKYQMLKNQFMEMCERRRLAPQFMLNNFEWNWSQKSTDRFGSAAESFWDSYDEAGELNRPGCGDHFIDTNRMFNEDFQKLPLEEQAAFLRQAIAQLHHALLFDETFNSIFTKKGTAERRKSAIKRQEEDPIFRSWYDTAHSMIYQTYQPIAVYDHQQSYFEHDMNKTADIGGAIEEYPFHRLLLAVIKKLKTIDSDTAENVKVVVDFWNKNRNPIFGNAVAELLSAQDPNRAASQLLALLKKEKIDKNPLVAILYRLEFGHVGISKEGVKYLEKNYDLGEYNNPSYHARRLTSDGEIGIFDEDLELIKYFHLGELDSEEKNMRAKILDFTYETLFLSNTNESAAERAQRLKYLNEFKKNYYQIATDKIFAETDVRLNNLSFREQGWFVVYFEQADKIKKDRLRDLLKKFGEDGLCVFLSLESAGTAFGETILSMSEKLPTEVTQAIFFKYSEIVRTAERTTEYLKDTLNNQIDDATSKKIKENLLRRGKNLLINFSEEITDGHIPPDNRTIINWKDSLESCHSDMMLFAETFKQAGASIEQMAKTEIVQFNASELTESDKKQILSIARANSRGREFDEKVVLAELNEALKNKNNRFYTLKNNGQIVSFCRFQDKTKDTVHFGSFNVDANAKNSGLGNAMMEHALENEARAKKITANVEMNNPIAEAYINQRGFVANKLLLDVAGTGVDGMEIIRDDSVNKNYRRNQTDIGMEREQFLRQTDELFARGFVITNYHFDQKQNKYFCTFENRTTSEQEQIALVREKIAKVG